MDRYFNLNSYEEKMKEIRTSIKGTYKRLHEELEESENILLNDLKTQLVEGVKVSEKDKKIRSEREKEYIIVREQILFMKSEMDSMIDNFQYAKVYNERLALKKFMDAVEVVNGDLQNHINESRPPVEEIS